MHVEGLHDIILVRHKKIGQGRCYEPQRNESWSWHKNYIHIALYMCILLFIDDALYMQTVHILCWICMQGHDDMMEAKIPKTVPWKVRKLSLEFSHVIRLIVLMKVTYSYTIGPQLPTRLTPLPISPTCCFLSTTYL